MNKRIVIILAASPDDAPYIKYYTEIFDSANIKYSYICWDRKNNLQTNVDAYVYKQERVSRNKIYRLIGFIGFSKYVNHILKVGCFDGFVLFGLQPAAFLSTTVFSRFRNKYIFDIRDFSKIYRIPFAKMLINNVLDKSFVNVISSLGFKSWLPKNYEYSLSHNINVSLINDIKNCSQRYNYNRGSKIRILTIGQLRDFEINSRFMSVFANNCKYELVFAGDGIAYKPLLKYAEDNHICNVTFTGRYKKGQELDIVKTCDYINIILPNDTLSKNLTSNRFYLSVLINKPMIVNRGCHQADLVEKYNLGIVTTMETLVDDIENYQNVYDHSNYISLCNYFIGTVIKDSKMFKSEVQNFINII